MLQRLIDGAAAWSNGQQRLNNVDQTHLVLWLVASLVYKKTFLKLSKPSLLALFIIPWFVIKSLELLLRIQPLSGKGNHRSQWISRLRSFENFLSY